MTQVTVIHMKEAMRAVIRRGAWRGREYYFAYVYAGIQPTEQEKQVHMKDWISACLYQLADPARNKDAESRGQALIALSADCTASPPHVWCMSPCPSWSRSKRRLPAIRCNNQRRA
jgi:hypothetical protein